MSSSQAPPHFATSSTLDPPHGFFSRHGGTSHAPFQSLNLSYTVGDEQLKVNHNRKKVQEALGLRTIFSVQQVHSDKILLIDEHTDSKEEPEGYDALITKLTGVGLMILHADCQPILLHAPSHGVIAAVHNGWRGSVANITGKTITKMTDEFSVNPADLRIAIGPSLGPCCGEFKSYKEELPQWMHTFQVKANHFNFWKITQRQLLDAGVQEQNIDTLAACTLCSDTYFSHRKTAGTIDRVTGRNGSVIGLPHKG